MGTASSLFIIFVVISFGMVLLDQAKWNSPLKDIVNSYDPETGNIDIGGLWARLLDANNIGLLILALAGGAVASLFTNDITYGLFAGFTIFMLGFSLLPISFFTDNTIPFFVKAIIGVPLALMFIMALIGWYRGSEL